MTDEEFYNTVEAELRATAQAEPHTEITGTSRMCLGVCCRHCRLLKLATEAADRATRATT